MHINSSVLPLAGGHAALSELANELSSFTAQHGAQRRGAAHMAPSQDMAAQGMGPASTFTTDLLQTGLPAPTNYICFNDSTLSTPASECALAWDMSVLINFACTMAKGSSALQVCLPKASS